MASSRWPLAALTLAIVVALTSIATPADAQRRRPKLSIADRGEQVEIIVHDVRLAAQPVMKLKGDRIELPLAGLPMEANDIYPTGLIARVDVRGEGQRWMSVKLRRMPSVAAALARGAMARQEDDGVHLFVPKAVVAAGTAPAAVAAPARAPAPVPAKPAGAVAGTTVGIAGATLPAVEAPVAPSAELAQADAPAVTAADTAAGTVTAAAGITGTGTTDLTAAGTDTAPAGSLRLTGAGTGEGKADTVASAPLTGGSGGPGFGRVIVAIGAIGLVGLAVVLFRRRRGATATAAAPQLDVLAARALGGKTRIVWLAVGDRELVVAVGPQQTNLLGQWRRGEAGERPAAALPSARTEPRAEAREPRADLRDEEPSFASGSTQLQVPRARTTPATSAVSGLMRLRGRTAAAYAGDAGADESDEQWARDILAAGGRR